jgi:hypothetical protein
MIRSVRRWVGIVAVQWALLAAAPLLSAQETPVPAARRFPIDTLAYFSVRNVTEFKEQWNKSLLGQLQREEGLAEFLQDVDEQFKKLSTELEREVGASLTDVLSIPHGEVAIGVVQAPGAKLGFIVMLEFGEQRELVMKLIEKGTTAAVDAGGTKSTQEFEDTEIHSFSPPAEAANSRRTPFPMQPCYFVRDSFFVLANHPDVIKTVITRWDGGNERVLANNESFKYIAERCRDENQEGAPLASWFIDPIGIVKTSVAAGGQNNLQAAMVIGFLPTLGLDRLRGMGGTYDIARGEFDSVSRTVVIMDPPVQGLNVFQFPAGTQAPPKWVPATASSYMLIDWDVAKAYTAIEALVDTFLGPGTTARKLQEIADMAEAGNIHVKKDIVDHLAGKVHVISESRADDDLESSRYLVALEIRNAAAVRSTLAKVANIEGFPGKTREFQGETIYEISTGENEQGIPMFYLGVAVAEGHLMISSDVKALEQVLRGSAGQEPLANSPEYRRIARRFPAETSMISFQRQDAQLKALYDLLRSGQSNEIFGGEIEIDFSKLPPFESVRKFLPPAGSYMEPDRRGLRIISFSLKKDAE